MIKHAKSLFLLLVCLSILLACGSPAGEAPIAGLPRPAGTAGAANGLIARQHLQALSVGIGPRVAGTPAEAQAAYYIEVAFGQLGYATEVQAFSFADEDSEQKAESANVIAVKAGTSGQEIIVGAHYDSVEVGAGADDNASGVAVLLEAAEKIRNVRTPYTIRFIAFGAEEADLDGSRFYVDQMSDTEIRNMVAMINLDSLIAGDMAYVYGDAETPGSLVDWILTTAQEAGYDLETRSAQELDEPDGTPCDCADYGPFQAVGIPFAYFEATNWNLGEQDGMTQVDPQFGEEGEIRHTAVDTIRYLDQTFPGRIYQHLDLFVTLLAQTLTQFKP